MDIKTQTSALSLILQLMDTKGSTVQKIPFQPQKPEWTDDMAVSEPTPRCAPEEKGLSSGYIADFYEEVAADTSIDPHSVTLFRGGCMIAQGGFGAYDPNIWQITHSQCKSITGLAIGMLADDGKLSVEDKVVSFFPGSAPRLSQFFQKNILVRHLLTMTSGVSFNETGAVTETDWVRCFLDSGVKFEPGTQFNYNSMNSYMLSAIVRQVSGEGLTEFLRKRLFDPLGIGPVFWEKCPQGIEKGGWGMYIRPEDMARIGQLLLQNGVWKGRRLISERWIEEATTAHSTPPESSGDFNYGYQIWVGRHHPSFLFNGMFGQNLLAFKNNGIMVSCTSGNDEIFQQGSFFGICEKYFSGAFPDSLPGDRKSFARLRKVENGLADRCFKPRRRSFLARFFDRKKQSLPCEHLAHAGNRYRFDAEACGAVGLMPLFAQAIQNNYTHGLISMAFAVSEGVFYVIITEKDAVYRLPVGFDKPRYITLDFHGDHYRAGVMGRFTTNEDDVPVLKLRISFLEIANARLIKVFFYPDRIVTKWSENPGAKYLETAFSGMLKGGGGLRELLVDRMGRDLLAYRINAAVNPELTALPEKSGGSEAPSR